MWLIRNLYAKLTKGSDGWAVNIALLGIVSISALLLISVFAQTKDALILIAFLIVSLVQCLSLFCLLRIRARVNDVQYSVALESTLLRSKLNMDEFFYDGAAGTPSLHLYILKVILTCQPPRILELGSGQTTRLLSTISRKNVNTRVTTLEQDADWWDRLKGEVSHERLHYFRSDLEAKSYSCKSGEVIQTEWYKDLPPDFFDQKFSFIIIDGPDDGLLGTEFSPYARAGIIWHMHKILSDSFVIIFDDADMYKHQMAIDLVKRELSAHGRKFGSCRIHGVKDQELIFSPEYRFLASI
jgi:hypothetical protein